MLEQFWEAASAYSSLKEALPEPRFGELPKKPRGRYAHLLPTLAGAFLFVEGLSLFEAHRAFAVAMIAVAAVIGVAVPLVAIGRSMRRNRTFEPAPENRGEPTGVDEHSEGFL